MTNDMNLHPADENFRNLYFVGAGGIGMANLERYFLSKGHRVAGYDKTPSALTNALMQEGVDIVFEDDHNLIPADFRSPEDTLVVYTPAVPADSDILRWFRDKSFQVVKRAVVLGQITRSTKAICISGSHGKTTTCSMTANILRNSKVGCNAFLGGILRNIGTNLVLSPTSPWSVIEADEYDRSFHQLSPTIAVVTSTDPDHLDIYGDEAGYLEGFAKFTSLIRPGGVLLMHTGLKLRPEVKRDTCGEEEVKVLTYSGGKDGDWHAEDITFGNGTITFTLVGPDTKVTGISLGVPVEINIDNAVAAGAVSLMAGATPDDVRKGLAEFKGAKRRFEVIRDGKDGTTALIDDYAHSPNEVEASIKSVKRLYPGRKLTVIFQPHLYTRTRDFAPEFAEALSHADEVIMPEIYPAREKPIPGVDAHIILDKVTAEKKCYCERKDLLNKIKNSNFDILMTLGAADIDRLLPEINKLLEERDKHVADA